MRGLSTYILAGVLAVVAMDVSILPGSAIGAWPQIAPAEMTQPAIQIQQVNRAGKGDRLDLRQTVTRQTVIGKSRAIEPAAPSVLPPGCEPAFSTLTASAAYAGNFVRGCIS